MLRMHAKKQATAQFSGPTGRAVALGTVLCFALGLLFAVHVVPSFGDEIRTIAAQALASAAVAISLPGPAP